MEWRARGREAGEVGGGGPVPNFAVRGHCDLPCNHTARLHSPLPPHSDIPPLRPHRDLLTIATRTTIVPGEDHSQQQGGGGARKETTPGRGGGDQKNKILKKRKGKKKRPPQVRMKNHNPPKSARNHTKHAQMLHCKGRERVKTPKGSHHKSTGVQPNTFV